MANQGRSSRETVESLIKDIDTFDNFVLDKCNTMERNAMALKDSWNDKQYEDFLMFIKVFKNEVVKDLTQIDNCSKNLKEILKKY